MNDMAWSSVSIHRLQLHNFGYCMTETPVYANIMRSPLWLRLHVLARENEPNCSDVADAASSGLLALAAIAPL
jgi:hypothetical protein